MMSSLIRLRVLSLTEVEGIYGQKAGDGGRGGEDRLPELVPEIVAQTALSRYRQGEEWFWCAPRIFEEVLTGRMVGSGCFKNSPAEGRVEIGYGVSKAQAGKGFASAAVALLVEEALGAGGVHTVTAETSAANRASERVLEKNGFRRVGRRGDPEDGELNQWEKCRRG